MNIQEIQDKFGKAVSAQKAGDDTKALRLLDDILIRVPTFALGWNQRGSLLEKLGASFDAVLNFSQAIDLEPETAHLYSNRGAAKLSLNAFQEAINDFDLATGLDPNLAEAHNNRGNAYRRMVKMPEAVACYRKAISVRPDYADAHLGLSMSLLELQEFQEGWKEFEWRFKSGQLPPRGLKMPAWQGEGTKNPAEILLIYGEQGYGDVLQFIRYVKAAKEKWGGRVFVEVRLPLARLVKNVSGVDGVIILGERVPDAVTKQVAMMTVPSVVGTAKGFTGAYIKPDSHLAGLWAPMLAQLPPGLRVGICWAGENREDQILASAIDARRSMSLDMFAPVARTKGVVWVSLQKGAPAEQCKAPPVGMVIGDFTSKFYDFYDTAALISQLDLVISVDTAVVHLAAALGKPTWMLSRFDGCWRWFGDRPDSPWYPSMRQFRQKTDGDWSPVVEQVWRELQQFVAERRLVA